MDAPWCHHLHPLLPEGHLDSHPLTLGNPRRHSLAVSVGGGTGVFIPIKWVTRLVQGPSDPQRDRAEQEASHPWGALKILSAKVILGPLHQNSEVGSGTQNFTYYLVSNSTSSTCSIHKMGEHSLLEVIMRNKTACVNSLSTGLTPHGHSANGSGPMDLLPPPSPGCPLRSRAWDGLWKEIKGTKIKKPTKAHQMASARRTGSQGATWLRDAERGRPTALRPALAGPNREDSIFGCRLSQRDLPRHGRGPQGVWGPSLLF